MTAQILSTEIADSRPCPLRILIVSADCQPAGLAEFIADESRHSTVVHAPDPAAAVRALESSPFDAALVLDGIPGCTAFEAVDLLHRRFPALPIVALVGRIGERGILELIRAGAADCVLTDEMETLPAAVDRVVKQAGPRRSERVCRLHSVLGRLEQAIAAANNRDDLFGQVCRVAVETGGFRMAWPGVADEAMTDEQRAALAAGRPVVTDDIAGSGLDRERRDQAIARGCRSAAFLPIRIEDRPAAVLTLCACEPGSFQEEELSLLQAVALRVSIAVESMERERQARALAVRLEARFRELLESAPDAILELDRQGRILLVNRATESLFGYTRDELLGSSIEILIPERFRSGRSGFETPGRDLFARRKDGTEFAAQISFGPVQSEPQNLVACVIRDVTERNRAERALRESHREIANVLESITDGFFALDDNWAFTYLNGRAEQLLEKKRETLLGRNFWEEFPDLTGSVFDEQYHKAAQIRERVEFQAFYPARKLWAEFHVYPSANGLSVYFQDITERKLLEEQLRQSQKMEAVGRLAGGVAHDFNNLLTIIGGYSQMIAQSLEDSDPIRKDVEVIVEAAERATELTGQLLAFSRRQRIEPKVVDLNRLVSRISKMLRRVIGEDVEPNLSLASNLGRIKADPGQIEQVVMNLVVNARDAMPDGGRLSIETADLEIGPEGHRGCPGLSPGRYTLLTVSDNGSGMDAEVLNHLFEPFFTTKRKGKGTGLGLSTVYGIVKQSGAEIFVESEVGRGSTFRIFFPRVDEPRSAGRKRAAMGSKQTGTETILLVEDETDVRKLTREMLVRQGYKVLEAAGGPEALRVLKRRGEAIDMLLTDVIMPQMSGCELARHVLSDRPGLRVLYMSGYAEEAIAKCGLDSAAFLAKPFNYHTLALRVRQAFDNPQSAASAGSGGPAHPL